MLNKEKKTPKKIINSDSAWKSFDFRMLIIGVLFSTLAGKIYELLLPLMVYKITHSAEAMGWMRAVEFLPYVFLAMIIGVWIDRVNRKKWSQWMLAGQFFCLIVSWLAIKVTNHPLWILFPCAFLMMAFNFGYINARMGMFKQILPISQQSYAISKVSMLTNIFQTLGPLISGFLFFFSDYNSIYLVISFMFFISWYSLGKVSIDDHKYRDHTRILDGIKQSWFILYKNKPLLQMSIAVSLFNMCMMMFINQSFYFVQEKLLMSTANIGLMVALSGIGGILGSFFITKIRHRLGLGQLFLLAILLQAFAYSLVLISKEIELFFITFFLIGFLEAIAGVSVYTWRQESIETANLGKVIGITGTIFKLAVPFGLISSGYITKNMGLNTLVIFCFVINIFVFCILHMSNAVRDCR